MLFAVNLFLLCAGLKGHTGGGSNGPSYTFHGDPHAMFAEFFGGRSPFDQFFASHGGLDDDMHIDDPFAAFGMGGMGGFPRSFKSRVTGAHGGREKKKDPPVMHELKVSLEEVFSGCTKKMRISRKRLNPDGCSMRTEDKILTVDIKRGWKEGTKITFPKEGDETPTNIPADIVFVVKDKAHSYFQRDGSDIVHSVKISLKDVSVLCLFWGVRANCTKCECLHLIFFAFVSPCFCLLSTPLITLTHKALCGCTISAPTLDGRTVTVTSHDVIKPGMKKRIVGEGLPLSKYPERRGDMVLEFLVTFPDKLGPGTREALVQILPP